MVPTAQEPESHCSPLNPGKAPGRQSRDPSSGGARGQDWALVSVGEQERMSEQRGEPATPCPTKVDLLTRAWEMHCKGSGLLTKVSSAVATHGCTGQIRRGCPIIPVQALSFLKMHSTKRKSPGCQSHPLDWGHVAAQSRPRKESNLDFPAVGGRAHILPVPEDVEGRAASNLPGRTRRPPVQPR